MTTTMQDEFEADYCEHSHRLPALVTNCRLSNGSYGDPCIAKAWHWFRRSREMLAVAAPTPLPAYDEDAERSACRKEWKRRNEHSHFEPIPFPDYWAGWKDSAQSRAKAKEDE